MNKKVLVVALCISLLAAGCGKKKIQQTPPPSEQPNSSQGISPILTGGLTTDDSGPYTNWRPYGSPIGKYTVKLPPEWFIDPESLSGTAGMHIYFGNNEQLDIKKAGVVVVELIAGNTKGANESLPSVLEKGISKGGNVGKTEQAITNSGLAVARVDRAGGKSGAPPGYAIEVSPTSYILVLPSSSAEDEMVRKIVSTIGILK